MLSAAAHRVVAMLKRCETPFVAAIWVAKGLENTQLLGSSLEICDAMKRKKGKEEAPKMVASFAFVPL